MPDVSRKLPPPLEAWIYCVATMVVVVLIVLPRLEAKKMPDSTTFTNFNIQRLEEARTNESGRLIVMLGDSKLKYAAQLDAAPESDNHTTTNINTVIRIVQNRAVFGDFEKIDRRILDLHPDLIVMQDSLFLHDRVKAIDFRLVQEIVLWRLFAPHSEFNPFRIDQSALQFGVPCSGNFSAEALHRRLRNNENSHYGLEHRNARAARTFVERAADLAIPVAILALPIHSRLSAEASLADYDRMIERVAEDHGASVWRVPRSLEITDADFCDFVHLNDKGRSKVSMWLNSQINGVVAQTP